MKRFVLAMLYCALCIPAAAQDRTFPRGAKPSPRHKLLAAPQHKLTAPPPAQFARIPAQNSMFGNDQFGCCVTSEEAFSKSCDGIFLATSVVVDWARQHGFLNGADLVSVMEAMASDGFPGAGSQHYDDGPYSIVDYGDQTLLQSAIAQGNVKIAINHNALPSTAGNQQGWYAIGGGSYQDIDHCVSICGYGPAEYLFGEIPAKVIMPPSLAGVSGYLVDTWGTIGFVDHAWLVSAIAGSNEAFVRNPTTVTVPAPTPTRLTFAEVMQLLIAKLFPRLTPAQASAAAEFFADDSSPRVNLLKTIAYQRALRAGVIPAGTSIDAVDWQQLLKIVEELEPLIVPLIPLLFGDNSAAPAALLAAAPPCGPNGCPATLPRRARLPVGNGTSPRRSPRRQALPRPTAETLRRERIETTQRTKTTWVLSGGVGLERGWPFALFSRTK